MLIISFSNTLCVVVALGLYHFYSSKWYQPLESANGWSSGFIEHQTASNLTYYAFTGQLEQSANDNRQHQLIRLSNNMVVLCTSDPDSSDSAATLSINVGSMANPRELQGMAHLLEHMLFMGSAKYPEENEYRNYISNNLGTYNAYTTDTQTNYYFSVANSAFEGALDRFSHFFIDPLLSADGVDRELNAVDSEFKGKLQSDDWRNWQLIQLEKSLSNQTHPYNTFDNGNYETLKGAAQEMGAQLHEKVREFYNQYYSADIIKLSVAGNHSLDQLVEWTVEKFTTLESKGNTKPKVEGHPLDQTALGKLVHMESANNMDMIFLQFALPELKSLYQANPIEYVSNLVSRKGTGSLLSYLEQHEWATRIYGYLGDEYDGFDIYSLNIYLTPKGINYYEEILEATFAYLQMLMDIGPQERIHSEMKAISDLNFEFYEKPSVLDWTMDISLNRHNEYVIPEHYLTKKNISRDFDASSIADILQYFNTQNYRAFVIAKQHNNIKCTETEKYYGTYYKVNDLPAHLVSNATTFDNAKYGFELPLANPFIPENTLVINQPNSASNSANVPKMLQKNEMHELWFKKDSQFFTPHGSINLLFNLANVPSSELDYVLANIAEMYVHNAIHKEFSAAWIAHIKFSVSITSTQLSIRVDGFNDKLIQLLVQLVHLIQTITIEAREHNMAMAEFRQMVEMRKSWQPYLHQYYENIEYLNTIPFVPTATLQQLLNNVTIDAVQQYVGNLFTATYFKMLVVGNFNETDAINTANQIEQMLASQPLYDNSHMPTRIVNIEPGHYLYRHVSRDPDTINNAVLTTFYCGMGSSPKVRVIIKILSQMLGDQFHYQLRTKEQLGYAVFSDTFNYDSGRLMILLTVQGESNPMYLTQRIDSFVARFHQYISGFSAEKFNSLVNSITGQIIKKPKTISGEADALWKPISSGTYNFELQAEEVASIGNVSLNDVLDVWNKHVNPMTAVGYTRLDSQVWSAKISYPTDQELVMYSENVDEPMMNTALLKIINNVDEFKATQPLHKL